MFKNKIKNKLRKNLNNPHRLRKLFNKKKKKKRPFKLRHEEVFNNRFSLLRKQYRKEDENYKKYKQKLFK